MIMLENLLYSESGLVFNGAMHMEDMLRLPDGTILGRSGGYIQVGDTRFYHEEHGSGPPVLMMHGAWTGIESLMNQVGPLSEVFRIILVERRGHGRTPDKPGKFTYQQGARDMMDVLDVLGEERIDLVGWSDGAVIGLVMAREFPQRIWRFVSISGSYHPRGYSREFALKHEESTVDELDPILAQVYGWTSPDGLDHFPLVFEKVKAMSSSHPRLTKRDLKDVETPTLVISGDDDIISLEHSVNFYKALPMGYLSIVPGSSHRLPMEQPEVVNDLIADFLREERLERSYQGLFNS
jgi:pimeloyl-ACP methyl ester carboxylesterase